MAMDFGFNGMKGLSIELMNHGDEPQKPYSGNKQDQETRRAGKSILSVQRREREGVDNKVVRYKFAGIFPNIDFNRDGSG